MIYTLCILFGLLIGGLVAWLVAVNRVKGQYQSRLDESERRANNAEGRATGLESTITELRSQIQNAAEDFDRLRARLSNEEKERVKAETERKETLSRLEDEKKLLTEAREKLSDAFKALASDSLSSNSQQFLKLAKEALGSLVTDAKGDLGKRQEAIDLLVKPLANSLKQFEEHLRSLEINRQQAYTSLEEHLKSLTSTQQQLQKETGNLVTALRTPQVRGRWGEMTLRRVVELAGMSEHCDFEEQATIPGEEGRLRPDLIVHLPSDRDIVVDAKVSLEAYLSATTAESEDQREELFVRHAQQVRVHMNGLSAKAYWDSLPKVPEFVVMFIPGESFFAEAAHHDTNLIEDGLKMKIVPATPTTLIALLRAVAYGWRQEQIAKSAHEISELGKQLYERMRVMADHLNDIGGNLEKANVAFNKAVRSLETRVLPSARRFKELGVVAGEEIPPLEPVATAPQRTTIAESPEPTEGPK